MVDVLAEVADDVLEHQGTVAGFLGSGWTAAWALWVIMFFVIEIPAIMNKREDDTLSEHLGKIFALRGKPKGWQQRRFALAAFLLWLTAHLFLEW